jgi:hypothetical protein
MSHNNHPPSRKLNKRYGYNIGVSEGSAHASTEKTNVQQGGSATMAHLFDDEFVHRYNPDGSVDSICKCCFRTAATAHDDTLLGILEGNHSCDDVDVFPGRMRILSPSPNRPK